jgi:two-component system CheB/CheR fusion protein
MTIADGADLETLLDFVKANRGFDFTGYKRAGLERRIAKRMQEVGSESYAEYLDFLEVHADEFGHLFDTLLINVTAFFRDAPMWEHLRDEVVPEFVVERPDGPIRVWSAGCASGEEPYTVAMILAEALGEEAFLRRVQIYATDADEDALQQGRLASYSPKQIEPVPPAALDRYFERLDGHYFFRPDLRRAVIFGRNDLVQDAPISRIDLLICRNTLMYFNAETQTRILRRFHVGLADAGVLMLGKSEMLLSHDDLFAPLALRRRLFRKVPAGDRRRRGRLRAAPDGRDGIDGWLPDDVFDNGPTSQVVIDAAGVVLGLNEAARGLLTVSPDDLGWRLQDLDVSRHPLSLRAAVDRARDERTTVVLDGVPWDGVSGDPRTLDVHVAPLVRDGEHWGATVSFVDVTLSHRLDLELERSRREVEEAHEMLQSTDEELETSNEELQSTNEELETTNEDLHSTNQELETMNAELRSTNRELEAINEELRTRTLELNGAQGLLGSILESTGIAVAVLDAAATVRAWNGYAQELWGLRPDDARGQPFARLDVGLPMVELAPRISGALDGEGRSEVTVEATDRRAEALRVRVTVVPLAAPGGRSVMLLMEPVSG